MILARTLRLGAALLAGAFFLAPAGRATEPASGPRRIKLEDRTFEVWIEGGATPSIVFESDTQGRLRDWAGVIEKTGKLARSFAYSRAGHGESPAVGRARSGGELVQELLALLQASDVPPPYILVGHGMGAVYLELLARHHTESDVLGMVMIDPALKEEGDDTGALERLAIRSGPRQELTTRAASFAEVEAAPPFPKIPLVVISSPKPPAGMDPARWLELGKAVAARSPLGSHIVAEATKSSVLLDQPELIVDAIKKVAAARRKGG